MTRDETTAFLRKVGAGYPEFIDRILRQDKAKETIDLWHEHLEKYTLSTVEDALKNHIRESKFAPKICEIVGRIEYEAEIF